jgi:hypothetical protein
MDTNDWAAATGSAFVGLGGRGFHRPINPRLLPHLAAKARPGKSGAAGARETRRLILQTAQLCGQVDDMLPALRRRGTRAVRDTTIAQQSLPGRAGARAMLQHWAAVQRARDRIT